jgi:uncharacterized protein YkwD
MFRSLRLVGLASLVVALAACGAAPARIAAPAEPAFYNKLNAASVKVDSSAARDMISLYRANNGASALIVDPALTRAAQAQADAMAREGQVTHGRTPLGARLKQHGVDPGSAAENVSAGYYTLAEAFSGWRDSRPHNANMLKKDMRRMGIATAFAPGTKYKVYWALVMTD